MATKTDGVGTPGNLPHVAKDSTFVKWVPDFKAVETKKLDAEIIKELKRSQGEQIYAKRFDIRLIDKVLNSMQGACGMNGIDKQLDHLLEAGTITQEQYDKIKAQLPKE